MDITAAVSVSIYTDEEADMQQRIQGIEASDPSAAVF